MHVEKYRDILPQKFPTISDAKLSKNLPSRQLISLLETEDHGGPEFPSCYFSCTTSVTLFNRLLPWIGRERVCEWDRFMGKREGERNVRGTMVRAASFYEFRCDGTSG